MDVYSELVESLENCDAVCNNCAVSSLNEKDSRALTNCIKLNLDCADVCHLALRQLARNSKYAVLIVEICMKICAECAEECKKYDNDQCRLSTGACRRCENHCRNYLVQVAESEFL